MKITDVRAGGPAAKAGLRGGDSIVRIGGKPVGTIYDYMESLKRYKPGDTARATGLGVPFRGVPRSCADDGSKLMPSGRGPSTLQRSGPAPPLAARATA